MKKYLNALWHVRNISYSKLSILHKYYDNFENVWKFAKRNELNKFGKDDGFADNFFLTKKQIDVDFEFEKLQSRGVKMIDNNEKEFPESLKNIPNPPFALYKIGAELPKKALIAVVGTRKTSAYGEKAAFDLCKGLAKNKVIIVSGLAFGIDAIAHRAAVNMGIQTIAVIASGICNITPSSHLNLARSIVKSGGSIISEYPADFSAFKYRYLERNRIISGLAEATIIVEAKEHSGSLITAKHALDQNKMIFAVPGDINKINSLGCNNLIKNAEAALITSYKDVLEYLGIVEQKTNSNNHFSETEKKLIGFLKINPMNTDELTEKLNLSINETLLILSELEMKSVIRKNRNFEWIIS